MQDLTLLRAEEKRRQLLLFPQARDSSYDSGPTEPRLCESIMAEAAGLAWPSQWGDQAPFYATASPLTLLKKLFFLSLRVKVAAGQPGFRLGLII